MQYSDWSKPSHHLIGQNLINNHHLIGQSLVKYWSKPSQAPFNWSKNPTKHRLIGQSLARIGKAYKCSVVTALSAQHSEHLTMLQINGTYCVVSRCCDLRAFSTICVVTLRELHVQGIVGAGGFPVIIAQ